MPAVETTPATARETAARGSSFGVGSASVLAVLAGAASAVQARVNGGLADRIGSPFVAGLQTVVLGTAIVALALLVRRLRQPGPRPPRTERVRWWYALGGLSGAVYLAVTSAAVPVVGVALVTVALVAGQSAGGLLVDKAGLGPGGHHAATPARVAGAALCVAAVGLAMLGRPVRELSPGLLALAALAGVLVAGQTAVNGRMRRATGDAGLATLVNMAGGLLVLTVVVTVLAATGRLHLDPWPHEPWLYLGGPLGVVYVTTAVLVVRVLGVLRVGLAVVAGSVIGALALDALAPTSGAELTGFTVVGALLTLVAVAVPGLDRRERL